MSFEEAFKFSMKYEVGPNFDLNDKDVINGICGKKTGFVNHPEDPGGLTKYGICQRANPTVDVNDLNLAQAMQIYRDNYWNPNRLDQLPDKVAMVVFDTAVNHGVTTAAKFLQKAVGIQQTGLVRALTIAAAQNADQKTVIEDILKSREDLYRSIVQRNPRQSVFFNGWMNRLDDIWKTITAN